MNSRIAGEQSRVVGDRLSFPREKHEIVEGGRVDRLRLGLHNQLSFLVERDVGHFDEICEYELRDRLREVLTDA